jgi:acetamidase/formamidase
MRKCHTLKATPETCFWGYFDNSLPPVLTIDSGDIVYVEAITHQAGDAPDLLMDDGIRAIYETIQERGPGAHIMTGPIAVRDAQPGDTLMVKILTTEVRLPYGTNLAAHWGYLYKQFNKERITVYRLDSEASLGSPLFAYDFEALPLYNQRGSINPPTPHQREAVRSKFVVPLRPHFGVMGVAPAVPERISSTPPGSHGGNIDNWRIGSGSTMYYPIFCPDALFFVGDPHMAQGDAELSGTAIEASMNAYLQIFVRREFPITHPVLETGTHWIVHGFGADLDTAMHDCAQQMLYFLTTHKNMSQDDAYSLMSTAVDFGITQVVDQKLGCHAALPKQLFIV